MSHNLRSRKNIDWKSLCFGEPLPRVKKEPVSAREILAESYEVERLIAKKTDPKEGTLFLVKWYNYPETETTWEPRSHIDSHSLSEYIPSSINSHRLHSVARAFEDAIQNRLKRGNRCCFVVIRFDLDIYRFCFGTDKFILLNSTEDIAKLPLSKHWHYRINGNGNGQKVNFPIRLTPKLQMRKVYVRSDNNAVQQKMLPFETVRITTATCAC